MPQKSDVYQYSWVIGFYVYLWFISNFVPRGPAQVAWGLGGIPMLIGGIFVQEQVWMRLTNPFPYIRAHIEPSGYILRMFVQKNGFIEKQAKKPGELNSTTLKLKYSSPAKGFGNVKEVTLNHELALFDRLNWTPGKCLWKGLVVDHPMTATCVLYEYPIGVLDVEYAEKKPVFRLWHAGKDYWRAPIPLSVQETLSDREIPIVLKQARTIQILRHKLATLGDQRDYYQTSKTKGEETIGRQDSELKGLLAAQSEHSQDVIQHFFAYQERFGGIDNCIKHMVGKKAPWLNKYSAAIIGLLISVTAIYGLAQTGHLGQFGSWLSEPLHAGVVAVISVAASIMLYLLFAKKK